MLKRAAPVKAPPAALVELIRKEATQPPPAAVAAIAAAARQRHGTAIQAVMFYGSVLRDGEDRGKIVDLYLLADSYREVHAGRLMRCLNRLLPPNVYYLETPFEGRQVRAKYALMTLEDFERLTGPAAFHPYFWARFCQPTAVAWTSDDRVRERVLQALARSIMTLVAASRPLLPANLTARDFWVGAFQATYRTELRAEPPERAVQLYEAAAARYDAIAGQVLPLLPVPDSAAERTTATRWAARQWAGRRYLGKLLSVLRLIKAAFTFQDGPDYLIWKISRHSGVEIELTPWQRRHPLLAAPGLFLRLYRQGAFR